MVGLSLTVSEIYGVIVRPLTSIISGMAEPIEFKFRRSLLSSDDSNIVTDIWAKYEKKLLSGFRDISRQSVTSS
jgi:hypothetical protein